MIIALQYILTLFFGYKIFSTKGWERLVWYLAGITLVSTAFNFFGGIALTKGHKIFVIFFITSLVIEGRFKLKNIKLCPLIIPLSLVFISYLCIGIFDTRLNPLMGIYRGVYNFAVTYGAFLLGWLSVDGKIAYPKFSKKLITIALVFTLYGLLTFVIKTNPILDSLGYHDRLLFEDAGVTFREFLVSGFLLESGVYGLSCFIFMLLIWSINVRNSKLQTITLALLFVNVFLTGTRSIMIPAIIGYAIYIYTGFKAKKKIQYLITGTFIFVIIVIAFPNSIGSYVGDIIKSILDVILPSGTGGSELGGSSLDVRDTQITAAFLKYLPEKLLFGHGFNYYQEVILVFNGGVNDVELYGMESYLCFLGVEYGLINIITVIIFFIYLIVYIIKNKYVNKKLYSLLLSITITFVIYLITAFMGDSWLYAMPVLGFLVALVEHSKAITRNNIHN